MKQLLKDILRSLRLTYTVNSLFNPGKLKHNAPLYKKYGIKKNYYSSVSSKDFDHLDVPDVNANPEQLKTSSAFQGLTSDAQESLIGFPKNGYAILRGFYNKQVIHDVNAAVDDAITSGQGKFRYGDRKMMFSHRYISQVAGLAEDKRLTELLSVIFNSTPHLFQSISFPGKGSEQSVHTDSIHLSTFPRGGMVGVWIAMEDIDGENGAIAYYPESHRLRYITNKDYDNEGSHFLIGDKDYKIYEALAKSTIEKSNCKKQLFNASAGDVLIWHANLFHAGEAHIDHSRTRKSTVLHYLAEDCIWYHEITQRPIIG